MIQSAMVSQAGAPLQRTSGAVRQRPRWRVLAVLVLAAAAVSGAAFNQTRAAADAAPTGPFSYFPH